MSKIFLPTEYINKPCYVVNNDYIRAYDNRGVNQNTKYYDIYFKNDYMVKTGNTNFTSGIICDSINTYTDNIYYRYDFPQILLTFGILVLICFWFPWRLMVTSMFKRWR